MLFDEFDFFIIENALKNKELNTWELSKKYIKTHFIEIREMNIRRYNTAIKQRLKRMEKLGLLIITKNPENKRLEYNLISDYVRLTEKRNLFPDGCKDCILIKVQNTWTAYQLIKPNY